MGVCVSGRETMCRICCMVTTSLGGICGCVDIFYVIMRFFSVTYNNSIAQHCPKANQGDRKTSWASILTLQK